MHLLVRLVIVVLKACRLRCAGVWVGGRFLKIEISSELAAACLVARVATGLGKTRGILCALEC
jgi:hypothetical protein